MANQEALKSVGGVPACFVQAGLAVDLRRKYFFEPPKDQGASYGDNPFSLAAAVDLTGTCT